MVEIQNANFKNFYQPHGAMFFDGCIYCGGFEKKEVLMRFIKEVGKPSNICFIDDKSSNLSTVKTLIKSLGIKFAGFHYTYVEDNPPAKVDEAILEYQFKLFTADDNDGKIWTPYNKAEESYASEHRALSRP